MCLKRRFAALIPARLPRVPAAGRCIEGPPTARQGRVRLPDVDLRHQFQGLGSVWRDLRLAIRYKALWASLRDGGPDEVRDISAIYAVAMGLGRLFARTCCSNSDQLASKCDIPRDERTSGRKEAPRGEHQRTSTTSAEGIRYIELKSSMGIA